MAFLPYANPLADQLGLLDDDLKQEAKLFRLCEDLRTKILTAVDVRFRWQFSDQASTGPAPPPADWRDWPQPSPRTVWGNADSHCWFAGEVIVPEAARGGTLLLKISSQWQPIQGSTDPQCLAYLDGQIAQAIDGNHTELVIARDAVPGERHLVQLNAFTFHDRPLVGLPTAFFLRNEPAEQLYYDLQTPLEVAIRLPQTDGRRHAILNLIDRALRALDRREGQQVSFEASLAAGQAIAREIYALTDHEAQPTVTAVGHTHLDVAWLWRVCHVRDKTGRSFATVLSLMLDYPDFVFMYNQSVLFEFLKTDYPALWARLKERVQAGQFEIEGAMWVEPDANIISGELMVRQIMRGRQFQIDEFGVTPRSVWLPDTFGYSANMPQILDRAGLDFFITSKLSWNDTNRQPYDSFFWQGIDGTRTRAQLITTQRLEEKTRRTVYNSDLAVSEVMGAWKRYQPKAANDELLVCYGYGDGGGGPTREMIERGRRLQRGIAGAPRLRLEGLTPFLDRLRQRMDADAAGFPVWNGELYLEYHRGTLTSVARNKAWNRKAERLMRELEISAALAAGLYGAAYPHATLRRLWDQVLINQFHDILPGTSIAEVYRDTDAEYAALFSELDSPNGPRISAMAALSDPAPGAMRLFNFTGQTRDGELVAFGPGDDLAGLAIASGGQTHALQKIVKADGSTDQVAPAQDLPPLGWTGARLVPALESAAAPMLTAAVDRLENEAICVRFDTRGEITSIFDKAAGRELLPAGQTSNRLIAFEDKPLTYDAWDIDHYFDEQFWPLADGPVRIEVVETGPHRAALRIARDYARSRIVQIVSLARDARQIEFDTHVDWQERQTVLKACFPFDLNVSEVRAEIQFGHVKRATHRNTSWDRAQFEASMHRWLDISEPDFGAALLNDCKYGYDAVEQQIRLTLLRGPNYPDADADLGQHRFRYALFLHAGVGDLDLVPRAAERFNNPISVLGTPLRTERAPPDDTSGFSFARADKTNVTLETVKKAERSDALVMRVYEHANRRCDTTITFGVPVASVRPVNLMEERPGEPLPLTGNAVQLSLRPFQLETLLVALAPGDG